VVIVGNKDKEGRTTMAQAAREETTKAKGRLNKIGNFYVNRISGDVMRKFIETEKIAIDDLLVMTDEQIGVALTTHFQGTTKREDMCKCDDCGGEAPDSVEACPFCGLVAEVYADGETATEEKAPEESTPVIEAEVVEDSDEPKSKKKAKTSSKKKTSSKDKEETMASAEKSTANGAGKSGELVQVKGKGAAMSKLTEKDLDQAVKDVIKLKTGAVTSVLELGHKILEINTKQLWKLRVDDEGKARYTGFDAFCHNELNLSPSYAYTLMNQAKDFSPEDIARLGRSKIALILKAPPEDRKAVQEKAEKGAPVRELSKEVKKLREEKGYSGESKKAKAGAKGGKAKAKKAASSKKPAGDKITIASIEGRKTIKLYDKPATLRNLDLSQCKRATGLQKTPFGVIELANEVTMYISIQKTDAGLVAVVDTRRTTSDEE
jgi:hypothetical protein